MSRRRKKRKLQVMIRMGRVPRGWTVVPRIPTAEVWATVDAHLERLRKELNPPT